jgi:hypothetical protein
MPDAYEADLGHATDAEWFAAHQALAELVGDTVPAHELAFIYQPSLDPNDLIGPDEIDHGPAYSEEAPSGSA